MTHSLSQNLRRLEDLTSGAHTARETLDTNAARELGTRLELLKAELKEDISAYAVGAVLILIGVVVGNRRLRPRGPKQDWETTK
jgi:hypothetical protein